MREKALFMSVLRKLTQVQGWLKVVIYPTVEGMQEMNAFPDRNLLYQWEREGKVDR